MKQIDVDVLIEWVENWITKNRLYHPYAKNNNIPITELYGILEQMPSITKVVAKDINVPINGCISRQAAIDAVNQYNFDFPQYMDRFVTELRDAMKADLKHDIEALPSAQPEELSCDGCKFCGQFEYQFPCKVCIRREKDYYARLD